MASSQKLISILFLLITLFSVQIHAREFFSKIPNVHVKTDEQVTPVVPNKEEQQTTLGKTEQEPRFIPETQNGYGLYGHESGQLPPSTTNTKETYEPYVTPVKYHPDEPYNAIPASKNNNKDTYFYSKNAYESTEQQNLGETEKESWSTKENKNEQNFGNTMFTEKGWTNNGEKQNLGEAEKESWSTKENKNEQNFGDAMFTEKGWTTKENEYNNGEKQNLGEAKYYNGNNGFNGEKQGMSDTRFLENGKYYHDLKSDQNFGESMSNEKNNKYFNGNNRYNGEKQGMSDTRFLENGKYFHDLKSENNYYPNQFENSRVVASRNEFDENRYNNNNNNMGRYNQNQEEFEENEEEEFEP